MTEYTLHYKKVKNITLRITAQGHVEVTVPYKTDKKRVEQFIQQKQQWIMQHQQKIAQLQQQRQLPRAAQSICGWRANCLFGADVSTACGTAGQTGMAVGSNCTFGAGLQQ